MGAWGTWPALPLTLAGPWAIWSKPFRDPEGRIHQRPLSTPHLPGAVPLPLTPLGPLRASRPTQGTPTRVPPRDRVCTGGHQGCGPCAGTGPGTQREELQMSTGGEPQGLTWPRCGNPGEPGCPSGRSARRRGAPSLTPACGHRDSPASPASPGWLCRAWGLGHHSATPPRPSGAWDRNACLGQALPAGLRMASGSPGAAWALAKAHTKAWGPSGWETLPGAPGSRSPCRAGSVWVEGVSPSPQASCGSRE